MWGERFSLQGTGMCQESYLAEQRKLDPEVKDEGLRQSFGSAFNQSCLAQILAGPSKECTQTNFLVGSIS